MRRGRDDLKEEGEEGVVVLGLGWVKGRAGSGVSDSEVMVMGRAKRVGVARKWVNALWRSEEAGLGINGDFGGRC